MQYSQLWFKNVDKLLKHSYSWTLAKKSLRWNQLILSIRWTWLLKTEKSGTKFRKATVNEKPLAVASLRLLTAHSYWTISKVFWIGKNEIFSFRSFVGIETYFFTSHAFHIMRKLQKKTGLTVAVNFHAHIYCPFFVCWSVTNGDFLKSCFKVQ